jgi:tetratricopeptide (TPR) repeat protein
MPEAEQEYLFRHALLCDVAYELQTPSDRGLLHWHALNVLRAYDRDRHSPLVPVLLRHAGLAALGDLSEEDKLQAGQLEAAYLLRHGDILRYQKLDQGAVDFYARLAAHSFADDEQRFYAHAGSAELFRAYGEMERADEYYTLAQGVLDRMENPSAELRPKLLTGRAGVRMARRDYAGAEQLLQAAATDLRALGLELPYAVNRGGLAILYRRTGRTAEAEACLREALEIDRRHGDEMALGNDLSNLANVVADLGRVAEAEEFYLQSIEVVRGVGGRMHEASAMCNLAGLYDNQKRYDEAAPLYERALEIQREIGNRRGWAVAAGNHGSLLIATGDMARGRKLVEDAVLVLDELRDFNFSGPFRVVLVRYHTLKGELTQARVLLDEMDRLLPLDRAAMARLVHYMPMEVRFRVALGDLKGAGEALHATRESAQTLGFGSIAAIGQNLAEAEAVLDEYTRAATDARRPRAINGFLRSELDARLLRRLQAQ